MSNNPIEPPDEVKEYIKVKYEYRDGEVDTVFKKNVGFIHKRGENKKPYWRVGFMFNGITYRIYRSHIVWFLCSGMWPIMEIDHIDRNTLNDKYDNLRVATHGEQQQNKDNYKYGFEVDKTGNGTFRARSRKIGVYLGKFNTREEAYEAINEYLEMRGML